MKRIIRISGIVLAVSLWSMPGILRATSWTNYTNTNEVRQISIASDKVWQATSGGVVAYTPSSEGILKLTNTDGLGGIDFRCVEVDTAGNLWFGTNDGWLTRIEDSGMIANYPIRDSSGGFFAREVTLYDIEADGDRLWIANDLGVSKFSIYSNGGEIRDTARKLGNMELEEDAVCLSLIGNQLWVGTARGIAFIDKDNQNIQYFGFWRSFAAGDSGLLNADIRSIASYHDTVIVGTADGIYKFETSPDTLWTPIGLAGQQIRKLLLHNDTLYAASNGGIYRYDGSNWWGMPLTGFPAGLATDIAIDSSGGLWAGTRLSGLAGYIDSVWTIISIPGPASNVIPSIAIDSTGAVWMTHDARGLSRLENNQWTTFNVSNSDPDGPGPLLGLATNSAVDIDIAADGNIWVGDWGGGLYKYDHVSWYHWDYTNCPMFGVPGYPEYWAASAVAVDDSGTVWVTSLDSDSGLVMGAFDPGDSTWERYFTGPNTVSLNQVTALYSHGNTLWVGMTEGLHRLDFGGTPMLQSDDSWQNDISLEFVSDIALDPFGSLWFGSPTGLYRLSPGTGEVRQVELLPEIAGSVNAVASDGVGNIWVGTVAGLGVLRPDTTIWRTYYTTDNSPLLNNEVIDLEIDIVTGIVYIGTNKGLSIFESGVEPPSDDLSNVAAYPNPVNIAAGDGAVYFKRIPVDAIISIYTVGGDLVESFPFSRQDYWNLKNSKGESIAGGIYIFLVESGNKSGVGKFAVIK